MLVANGKKMIVKVSAGIWLFNNKVPHISPLTYSNETLENLIGCSCELCREF
jgi:hypothetical protein